MQGKLSNFARETFQFNFLLVTLSNENFSIKQETFSTIAGALKQHLAIKCSDQIGNIFSQKDKSKTRTELIVFIKPQIITNSVDAHMVADEFRSKLDMMRDQSSVYDNK